SGRPGGQPGRPRLSSAAAVAVAVAAVLVAAAVAVVAAAATAAGLAVGRPTFHLLFSGQPAPAVADPAAPDLPAAEVLVERPELAGEGLELRDPAAGVGQLVGDGGAEPRVVGFEARRVIGCIPRELQQRPDLAE